MALYSTLFSNGFSESYFLAVDGRSQSMIRFIFAGSFAMKKQRGPAGHRGRRQICRASRSRIVVGGSFIFERTVDLEPGRAAGVAGLVAIMMMVIVLVIVEVERERGRKEVRGNAELTLLKTYFSFDSLFHADTKLLFTTTTSTTCNTPARPGLPMSCQSFPIPCHPPIYQLSCCACSRATNYRLKSPNEYLATVCAHRDCTHPPYDLEDLLSSCKCILYMRRHQAECWACGTTTYVTATVAGASVSQEPGQGYRCGKCGMQSDSSWVVDWDAGVGQGDKIGEDVFVAKRGEVKGWKELWFWKWV